MASQQVGGFIILLMNFSTLSCTHLSQTLTASLSPKVHPLLFKVDVPQECGILMLHHDYVNWCDLKFSCCRFILVFRHITFFTQAFCAWLMKLSVSWPGSLCQVFYRCIYTVLIMSCGFRLIFVAICQGVNKQ